MALIDNDENARRLAAAIASDIFIYNSEKIAKGLQADDFFDSLAEELEEGRTLFRSRVTPEIFERGFYDRAIVDTILLPMGGTACKAW